VSDFRGGRAAGLALAAGIALGSLVACSAGDATDPATVESAVVRATDCDVHPRFGRSLGSINALLTVGPSGIDAPHEALDGSFICSVEPPQQGTASTLVIGAARFGDPAQAVEMVEWLRGGMIGRPVAAVGPWMLFSARPYQGPQDSPELEVAVTELGGQMTETCR
jgi:hypothetical protein